MELNAQEKITHTPYVKHRPMVRTWTRYTHTWKHVAKLRLTELEFCLNENKPSYFEPSG